MGNIKSIWIGFDMEQAVSFFVAQHALIERTRPYIPCLGLYLEHLKKKGLYYRPTKIMSGRLWDEISNHPMSTEFANSRFLALHLHRELFGNNGWALFMDSDMLPRTNFNRVFDLCDDRYAVMCVKHDYRPEGSLKMNQQVQSVYECKNWSSFMMLNAGHPANDFLTVELINSVRGIDLHRFCWIKDRGLIGSLPLSWNWLVGHSPMEVNPDNVHFTEGGPWHPGYVDVPYADEWRKELQKRVGCDGYR